MQSSAPWVVVLSHARPRRPMRRPPAMVESAGEMEDAMSVYAPFGLGPCAAPAGHDGTCAQASGWDKFTDDAKDASYEAGFAAGRAAALAEQGEVEWEYGACYQADNGRELLWFSMGNGGFTIREAAEREVERYADAQIELCRRRKAGPWVPVNENGETP